MTFLMPDCFTVIDNFRGGQDFLIPDASAFTRLIGGVHKIVRTSVLAAGIHQSLDQSRSRPIVHINPWTVEDQ
jgi:hypothetical protein